MRWVSTERSHQMLDPVEPSPQPVVRPPRALEKAAEVIQLHAGELGRGRVGCVAEGVFDPGARQQVLEGHRDRELLHTEGVSNDFGVERVLHCRRAVERLEPGVQAPDAVVQDDELALDPLEPGCDVRALVRELCSGDGVGPGRLVEERNRAPWLEGPDLADQLAGGDACPIVGCPLLVWDPGFREREENPCRHAFRRRETPRPRAALRPRCEPPESTERVWQPRRLSPARGTSAGSRAGFCPRTPSPGSKPSDAHASNTAFAALKRVCR